MDKVIHVLLIASLIFGPGTILGYFDAGRTILAEDEETDPDPAGGGCCCFMMIFQALGFLLVGIGAIVTPILAILYILMFGIVFPIIVYIDATKREIDHAVLYAGLMVITGPIGLLIYYFGVRKKAKAKEESWEESPRTRTSKKKTPKKRVEKKRPIKKTSGKMKKKSGKKKPYYSLSDKKH